MYKRTKRKFRDDGVAIRNPKSGQPDFAHRSRESTPRASGWVRFKLSGPNTIGPSSCRLHFSIQANGSRVLKRQTGARFIQTSPKILAFLPSWNFSGHWFWLSKPLPTSQYPGKHSFANLAHRWRDQNHGFGLIKLSACIIMQHESRLSSRPLQSPSRVRSLLS